MTTRPFWFWCIFPALTMSLGWGLRGSIGGGPLGAMIPGAMVALALCMLLGRHDDAGRVAAFGALGVGLGGQETYGQTVGLSLQPDTFAWAMLGFGVKGAAWGLLGGAFLGVALSGLARKRAIVGIALMVVGTWIGWAVVNEPKLVYFSNRLDKPREELWAGLWVGGLLMLAWCRDRVAWWFAFAGAVGGGVGFAFGASLQPWGRGVWPAMPLGWWKGMELTFGALLGAAYGAVAWRFRSRSVEQGPVPAGQRLTPTLASAVFAIVLAIVLDYYLPVRFGYSLGAGALACFVLFSETLAWQTAVTATYAAFASDLMRNQKLFPDWVLWCWVIGSTVAVAFIVARHPRPRPMVLLLTWTAVVTAFRYLLPPARVGPEQLTMLGVFVLLGTLITVVTPRASDRLDDASFRRGVVAH